MSETISCIPLTPSIKWALECRLIELNSLYNSYLVSSAFNAESNYYRGLIDDFNEIAESIGAGCRLERKLVSFVSAYVPIPIRGITSAPKQSSTFREFSNRPSKKKELTKA